MQESLPQVVAFPGDGVITSALNCVRLAYNEIYPDKPVANIDDLAQVSLHDKMEGELIIGVIVLRKGVWAPSYHILPGDEAKVREKIQRGHRPLLVASLWNGDILCEETGRKLVNLATIRAINPHIRRRLETLYAMRNG